MLEQEVVDLGEQVHPALTVAVFITAVDAVILVGVNHQVKLLAVADHGLDEFHGVLVVDVIVAATMAEQVILIRC